MDYFNSKLMNNTKPTYKRKHTSRNFHLRGVGIYHPETLMRMAQTGLSRERMQAANEHRKWKAYKRILLAKGKKDISNRRLCKLAKAHHRTVKMAVRYTFEHVCSQVRQALEHIRILTLDTYIKILPIELRSEEPKTKIAQNWYSRVMQLAQKYIQPTSMITNTTSRSEEESHLAREFQAQIEKERAVRGDGDSILMKPLERKAWLERERNKPLWLEVQANMKRMLQRKKKYKYRLDPIQ